MESKRQPCDKGWLIWVKYGCIGMKVTFRRGFLVFFFLFFLRFVFVVYLRVIVSGPQISVSRPPLAQRKEHPRTRAQVRSIDNPKFVAEHTLCGTAILASIDHFDAQGDT